MAYSHPFIGVHLPGSLLPDWRYDILIVGLYQTLSTSENEHIPYFYGNTECSYFWDLLPEIFSGQKLKTNPSSWIPFLQEHQIGLTDLVLSMPEPVNEEDAVTFDQAEWNTEAILRVIRENKIGAVFVVDMSSSPNVEAEIEKIKAAALVNEIHFGKLICPCTEEEFSFTDNSLYYPQLFGNWFDTFSPIIQVRVR